MKNAAMADLNFRSLLNYGGQPKPFCGYPHNEGPHCSGYCVSCEEGIVETGCLDLMSHGCDTSDYESVLGPLPPISNRVEKPVLFLLEDPGGDGGNGGVVQFQSHHKQPPIYHYYWLPHVPKWPTQIDDIKQSSYGLYFAYLMVKHGLVNTYITNLVKCRLSPEHRNIKSTDTYRKVRANCFNNFLAKELDLFSPEIVFCFGQRVQQGFRACGPKRTICYLCHPAARKSWANIVADNDARIEKAIKNCREAS